MAGAGEKNVLCFGLLSPVDLDPRESQDFLSDLVLNAIYESPYEVPASDQEPRPLIFADALRRDGDAAGRPSYSAAVRDGLHFSDGTPVRPQHVVDSLSRARPFREHARVRLDGGRVAFELARPNARFDLFLTQRFCAVAKGGGPALLGTGPYMLAESRPEEVRLVRNPHHHPAPAIDELVFRVYPPDEDGRPTGLLDALRRGEVDLTNVVSRQDLRAIQGLRPWFEPGNSTAILYFNTERPFLADARVRKALAMVVDRAELAGLFYTNPLPFTATGLVPTSMGQWRDRIFPDLERAKALLADSGVSLPDRLTMHVIWSPRPYLPQPRAAAEHIAARWQALGLDVEIEMAAGQDDYLERICAGSYEIALSGWIADTPDPADFLDSTLHSRMIPMPGESVAIRDNLSRWRHDGMDHALEAFRENAGADEKAEILRLLNEEVPLFPLFYGSIAGKHAQRVKGFRLSPLGLPLFAEMTLGG